MYTLVWGGYSDGIYSKDNREFSWQEIERLGYKFERLIGKSDEFITNCVVPELLKRRCSNASPRVIA